MKTAVIFDKWLAGMGGGEVVACTLARTLKDNGYDVLFLSRDNIPTKRIKNTLGIDLTDITFKQASNEQEIKQYSPDLFINISFMDYSYGIGKKNIYYVHFPSPIRSGLFDYVLSFFEKTNLHSFFPKMLKERIEDRLKAGIYPDMVRRLNSYSTFLCHSEYVGQWIKIMWNKEAIVIYPPVRLITQISTVRQNWIASVGRFFTLGHGKKQEVLIDAFKKLFDQLKQEDLQLHLIGGVGKEPSSIRYVEQLKKMAQGYPIFFHFDVKRDEIEKLLLQSKIYWHAGGFGEINPINFEHFGIAPVEAISAGCIPVLFNGGGLPEILEQLGLDKIKYTFSTILELISRTRVVISEKQSNQLRSKNSINVFSTNSFQKIILNLLK